MIRTDNLRMINGNGFVFRRERECENLNEKTTYFHYPESPEVVLLIKQKQVKNREKHQQYDKEYNTKVNFIH